MLTQVPGLTREVTDEEVEQFDRDGVVCLRSIFEPTWVDAVHDAVQDVIDHPTVRANDVGSSEKPIHADNFLWLERESFRSFATRAPVPVIASRLLGGPVKLFFDGILVKEPGTEAPTPWHQDLPYYPFKGRDLVSIWIGVDPVTRASGGVEYVAGSHLWPERYQPASFRQDSRYEGVDLPKVPDIDSHRDGYRIVSWDLEPGDCVAHHGLTLHGASGNSTSDIRRRALINRYIGADMRWAPAGFAEDFYPYRPDLEEDDPIVSDLFPEVWPATGGQT